MEGGSDRRTRTRQGQSQDRVDRNARSQEAELCRVREPPARRIEPHDQPPEQTPRYEKVQMGQLVDERVLEREVVEGTEEVDEHRPVRRDGDEDRIRNELHDRMVQDLEKDLLRAPT